MWLLVGSHWHMFEWAQHNVVSFHVHMSQWWDSVKESHLMSYLLVEFPVYYYTKQKSQTIPYASLHIFALWNNCPG